MFDLLNIPICELTPAQKKAREIRIRSACIEEGRNSFLAGFKLSACPPFRDPMMAEEWKFGWQCEKDDREMKLPRSRRIFHPEMMERKAQLAERGADVDR
jgi:hypothetical protein